jgi:hypothetical protein
MKFIGGKFSYAPADEGPACDWWFYEDLRWPTTRLSAAAGFDRDEVKIVPITYDEMRPGCWDPKARLEDMDINHVPVLRPDVPRGQGPRPRAAVRQGVQRLDGRRVVRRHRRSPDPAVPDPAVGREPGR